MHSAEISRCDLHSICAITAQPITSMERVTLCTCLILTTTANTHKPTTMERQPKPSFHVSHCLSLPRGGSRNSSKAGWGSGSLKRQVHRNFQTDKQKKQGGLKPPTPWIRHCLSVLSKSVSRTSTTRTNKWRF